MPSHEPERIARTARRDAARSEQPGTQAIPLSAAERHRLLEEWNRTDREYPRDRSIHQLFAEQAARTPTAEAVAFAEGSLTYGELDARADRLARRLCQLGVGRGALVALCFDRSPAMVVTLLAILKAGGAYVPLDPAYPKARLGFMLEDSQARVLVTEEKWRSTFASSGIPMLCVDAEAKAIAEADPASPDATVGPEDPAYVVYTSGSTGLPKGVVVPHRGVVRLVKNPNYVALGADETILQLAPLSFDASTFELWGALLNGGRVALAPPGQPSPIEIGQAIQRYGVTTLWLTAGLFHLMVEERLEDLKPLRQLLAGGDVLFPGHVLRVRRALPHCRLINGYGPTENTTFTCCHTITDEADVTPCVPIGRPISNTQVYVLDEQLEPVPVGVAGELYTGGDGVALGYLNDPGLTAERFIPDPFRRGAGARLYRTGDRVRWRADGNLEFLGRLDQQVKIRGFRIEPGEIESALGKHPTVTACAVVAQSGPAGDRSITAFIVLGEGTQLTAGSLRTWLAARLPEHMIPTRLVALTSLPLTPNGKVDRQALASTDGTSLPPGTDYVAPRTELERTLAGLWQEVLRRERVGIRDDFFELGGHSLLAMTVRARLAAALKLEVPIRWLFEQRTIEELSRRIEADGQALTALVPITKADRQHRLPASFGQQAMWLLQKTQPDAATYNQSVAHHVPGPVDNGRLRRSLEIIVNRHETLRTALVLEDGELVQTITAPTALTLPWKELDLRDIPDAQRPVAIGARLLEEARRPFDLAQAPMWRVLWLITGNDRHILQLTFHHGIEDEWSRKLLLDELERLYAADGNALAAGLDSLPAQYADLAVWQRKELAGARLEMDRAYWSEQLKELPPPLRLSTDRPPTAERTGRGAMHRFELPAGLTESLRALALQESTSLFGLVLAAFQVWLFRCSGQDDLVVGAPVSRRDRPESQRLLGFFLNTLPLRARFKSGINFKAFLTQVRTDLRAAMEHAALPFEQMVALAVSGREGRQLPLYQAMFVLVEQGLPRWHLDRHEVRPIEVHTGTAKCDLLLNVVAEGGTWACELEYATDMFTAEGAARMMGQFAELLHSLAAAPGRPIEQANFLPPAERHRLVVDWNQTAVDHPGPQTVRALFEQQVERAPAAVALLSKDGQLSYAELNARANRLAHRLIALGVGPEILVAVVMERSFEIVVSLLAILKAGGVYVPIDAANPPERIRQMLDDCAAPILLTASHLLPLPSTPRGLLDVIAVDQGEQLRTSHPDGNPPARTKPEHLVYAVYTSGSTGRPKAVAITQRGLFNLLQGMRPILEIKEGTRLLGVASPAFDISVAEMLLPLIAGGTTVLVAERTAGDPTLLAQWITESRPHIIQATPATWAALLDSGWPGYPSADFITTAEALPEAVGTQLLRRCRRLWDLYGPTETTIWSLYRQVTPARVSGLIGRPIANTSAYILDQHGQPLPVGVVGELHLGGVGLAREYLNRPELTAEKFIPDPFAGTPGARMYRTGDRCRWNAEGTVEFLGRLDHQIKLRGYRIELGEIEAALGQHASVARAAVLLREDNPGDKRLVAYVVPVPGFAWNLSELTRHLRSRLPKYMVPAVLIRLDALPTTPNGKLDRRALPVPDDSRPDMDKVYVAPRDPIEAQLVVLWGELLGLKQVGVHDNFFDLGGHSLLAVRLSTAIERQFGRALPAAVLFQTPTVSLLAAWLSGKEEVKASGSLVPLQPLGTKPPLFLIHGWGGDVYCFLSIAQELAPDQPVYGVQALGLEGKTRPHTTVEQMAAHYVKEIRSFQPGGPYHLGGHSLGGVFAYEIARQLRALGQKVAVLVLFDTVPPGAIPWAFYAWQLLPSIPQRCLLHLRNLWRMSNRRRVEYVFGRFASAREWLSRNRPKAPLTAVPQPDGTPAPPPTLAYDDYYYTAALAYRVRPYPGRVNVFLGVDAIPMWKWYWRYMARGGARFHHVPGAHDTMITPGHVAATAKTLRALLERSYAQEKAATPPRRPDAGHIP